MSLTERAIWPIGLSFDCFVHGRSPLTGQGAIARRAKPGAQLAPIAQIQLRQRIG